MAIKPKVKKQPLAKKRGKKLVEKEKENYKLFGLSLDEYKKINELLGHEPDDFELGIFSAMWSEHCSYKSSKVYLKTLPTKGDKIVIGPGENAGAVDFGGGDALIFKMESHNHPSFIEPFQGAATGVGGIMRDIFTMGARPIANLNSLRFGSCFNPKTPYYVSEVVKGIGFYGNCMGVPTVGGEVVFDECYNDNILVNAFTIGIVKKDGIFLSSKCEVGNIVVYVGSATGMDGIHGATMASEEFDSKKNKKRSTVQVGDPFTEKLLLEACLEAMDKKLIVSIQDMGAAGITSSSFEMADKSGHGMIINLDAFPLRTPNMTPVEIMLSESQERMLLATGREDFDALNGVFDKWGLNCVKVGEVIDEKTIKFYYNSKPYKSLDVGMVVNGPAYNRPKIKPEYLQKILPVKINNYKVPKNLNEVAERLIMHPNIASKRPIFTQYDYSIGTNTVTPPGFSAAVLRVKGCNEAGKDGRNDNNKGFLLNVSGNSRYAYLNPYMGGVLAVAECARNIAACGGTPVAITDCLNFASPEDPEVMWQFSEVVKGIKDAAIKLNTPVISGNVSFYNETAKKETGKTIISKIYPTPVIGMVGFIEDVNNAVTPYFKDEGDEIFLLGRLKGDLGGSLYMDLVHKDFYQKPAGLGLDYEISLQNCIRSLINSGMVKSAADISEGGIFVALAESSITNPNKILGFTVDLNIKELRNDEILFSEFEQAFIITSNSIVKQKLLKAAGNFNVSLLKIGTVGKDVMKINNTIELKSDTIKHGYERGVEKIISAAYM
ncbi:MAG: phosphoribosylformylglycinamidine synthase subunit PurL [Deltaproteobacteria bacterium]|nr:phosphoribosylformylglycinamidine synthase subunit PurL [Deltaproteobacteria bacterium]MCL5891599.1 phosphoribosylformylglycinamidine synthase subunit PurL [Deltaproteobacteria bacterium]